MKNFVQKGDNMEVVTPSGGYTSGQIVVVGALAGVCAGTTLEGETAIVALEGVFTVPKVASGAIAQGVKIYVAASGGSATATVGSNIFLGYAWKAAADGDTTIQARLIS